MFDVPIETSVAVDISRADAELRHLLSAKFAGMTAIEGRVTLHVEDLLTRDEFLLAKEVVETGSFGLTVVTDKPQLSADGEDTATIVCNNPIIAVDEALAYTVTFTGVIDGEAYQDETYATGTAPVEGGAVTLTLAVDFAGAYRVTLRRTAPAALEFGAVTIQAVSP